MSRWAKIQPQDGDAVVHCGHRTVRGGHFWKSDPPVQFRRPDGTRGGALFIYACDPCSVKAGGDPARLEITGDGKWMGNAPAILADD